MMVICDYCYYMEKDILVYHSLGSFHSLFLLCYLIFLKNSPGFCQLLINISKLKMSEHAKTLVFILQVMFLHNFCRIIAFSGCVRESVPHSNIAVDYGAE